MYATVLKKAYLQRKNTLLKDDCFVTFYNNPVLQIPFNCTYKHSSLYLLTDFFQCIYIVTMVNAFDILFYNRSFIQIICDKMRCRTNKLDSSFMGSFIGTCANKCR